MYNQSVEGLETLTPYLQGGGGIKHWDNSSARLEIPPLPSGYADSQLDDTQNTPRNEFRWNPPLRMFLRMRATPACPLGTLGFGFWNDPFALSLGAGGAVRRFPATPQAIWFFYGSRPNDLAFDPRSQGHGWKAMCLRSPRLPGLLLLPGATLTLLLSQIPLLRGPIMRIALGQVATNETLLSTSLDEWHSYEINWTEDQVDFLVDGDQVLSASSPPSGPLGFVTWIDNQYGIASPKGGIRFGTLPTSVPQRMEIVDFSIE